jgi:hypothetical protein
MSITPSRFALWGRMIWPLLAFALFFGPTIATFATARPVVPVPAKPPVLVISAHPFLAVSARSCSSDPPIHEGPHERTGQLSDWEALDARMLAAATDCLKPAFSSLTLVASVDARGNIGQVLADASGDEDLAACAIGRVRGGGVVETRGPGSLKVGYFTGPGRL